MNLVSSLQLRKVVASLALMISGFMSTHAGTRDTAIYQSVKKYLDEVPAIDTHDHLWPFEVLPGYIQTPDGHGMTLASIWRNSYYAWFNPISPWTPNQSFQQLEI